MTNEKIWQQIDTLTAQRFENTDVVLDWILANELDALFAML